MGSQKKLGIYLVAVNLAGLLTSVAVTLYSGLFEGLLVFPIATLAASFLVHSKQKRENSGDSSDNGVENLVVSED